MKAVKVISCVVEIVINLLYSPSPRLQCSERCSQFKYTAFKTPTNKPTNNVSAVAICRRIIQGGDVDTYISKIRSEDDLSTNSLAPTS